MTYFVFCILKRENKNTKPPLPLARCGPPYNTAIPRPTARITPNRCSDGRHCRIRIRREVPIGYNCVTQMRPQKYPVPLAVPQNPLPDSTCLIPGPVRPMIPNGCHRWAVCLSWMKWNSFCITNLTTWRVQDQYGSQFSLVGLYNAELNETIGRV